MDAIPYVRVYCWCAAIEHTTSSHFALCVKQLATALNVYSTKKNTQSTYPRLQWGSARIHLHREPAIVVYATHARMHALETARETESLSHPNTDDDTPGGARTH